MRLAVSVVLMMVSCFLSCRSARVIITQHTRSTPAAGVSVHKLEKAAARLSDCAVYIRTGFKSFSPLLIQPRTDRFYSYSASGHVKVVAGQSIEMHCTSGFAEPFSGTTHLATCVGGTGFRIDGIQHNISAMVCTKWPAFVAKKSGHTCKGGTTLVDVGFELSKKRFLRAYQVCFHEVKEVTRYVYHTLEPGNTHFQSGVERLDFVTGGFFGNRKINRLYSAFVQKQTLNETLGGVADRYFDETRGIYLSRGHMGAKADFVYGAQQRATFLFINVAPQWQSFNSGNWQEMENGLRGWVSQHGKSVECWTGVWGVTSLPNKKGVQTPLYLDYDKKKNGLIPVPRLYFRVVIEPSSNRGVVLIGVNNPHLTLKKIQEEYIICPDVSDRISWMNWKKTDIVAGYSYACEVHEFRKRVTHLPQFEVNGLLY